MRAVFICRPLTSAEAAAIREEGVPVFRRPSVSAPAGLDVSDFELSAAEKDRLSREVFRKVLEFGDLEMEGKTVAQHLSYGSSSDWYSHRFRIYFEQRDIAYALAEIRLLAQRYEQLMVYHPFMGVDADVPANVSLHYGGPPESETLSRWSVLNYAVAFLFRAVQGYFQVRRARPREHIILYRPVQEHHMLALDGRTMIKDDFLLGYMLQEAPQHFLLVEEFNTPLVGERYKLRWRHFGGRPKGRRYLNGEHIVFRGLISGQVKRKRKAIIDNLGKRLEQISKHVSDPLHMRIVTRLRGLNRTRRLYILRKLAYERFFRKWNIKTITGTDENNAFTKPVLDAFKELQVTTIGVQHGTMSDMHPSFRFTKKDLLLQPMPDKTIVWGEEWKRGLVDEGNYPPASVVVCGQQRTDLIPVLKSVRKKDVIPGLDDARPLLVFASQPQPDQALRERAAWDVLSLWSKIPELQIVIKLHPRERYDKAYYERIAGKAGSKHHRIIFKVDLYRLISASDMVITCFSTVGSEAVYFRKPLIVLDHLNQDLLGYVRRGVAFHATNGSELETAVKRVLTGERCSQELIDLYIADFAYRIDAKARFRYLQAIVGTQNL